MDPSDLPADIARLLARLRDALVARGGLAGIYLYGSLATGDFSPARSDIDLVVMVNGELDPAAADPVRLHPYWYGDRITQWQLKVLTRAELAAAGMAPHGPRPPPVLGWPGRSWGTG